MIIYFFFQAEDGIRVPRVTGVKTCALPFFALEANVVRGGDAPDVPSGASPPRTTLASSATSATTVPRTRSKIGRASCREREEISGVPGSLKKKKRSETRIHDDKKIR